MERKGLSLAVGALVLLSGCAGFVTGTGPLDVRAAPAAVSEDALSGSGYERVGGGARTLNETVTVLGQERRVSAEIHVNTYARLPENVSSSAAQHNVTTLALVSVPAPEVAGWSPNPLQFVPDDLLFALVGGSGEFNGTVSGTTTVTMLGAETEATTYRMPSERTDTVVQRASVQHGTDIVVAVIAYPEGASGESARRLLTGIEHPANATS